MKLREMLKKTRLRVSGGEDDKSRPIDAVDALAKAAPPNWVPSQQDDGPRH